MFKEAKQIHAHLLMAPHAARSTAHRFLSHTKFFAGSSTRSERPGVSQIGALILLSTLTGCATPSLTKSGALTSYGNLTSTKGRTTKTQVRVRKEDVLAAKTVRIVPARFADGIGVGISYKNRDLVTNAINRTLCRGLSKRFNIVNPGEPADLTIYSTITDVRSTNRLAAGASVIAGFIPSALSSIPFVNPRIPFGLGRLTVEAEALDSEGGQDAAIIWARGADPIRSSARVSEIGDAYALASNFGGNFSELLITGEKPSRKLKLPQFPQLGRSKKDSDCAGFGKGSGILGKISENFGAPPGMIDKGRKIDEARAAPSLEKDSTPPEID